MPSVLKSHQEAWQGTGKDTQEQGLCMQMSQGIKPQDALGIPNNSVLYKYYTKARRAEGRNMGTEAGGKMGFSPLSERRSGNTAVTGNLRIALIWAIPCLEMWSRKISQHMEGVSEARRNSP